MAYVLVFLISSHPSLCVSPNLFALPKLTIKDSYVGVGGGEGERERERERERPRERRER